MATALKTNGTCPLPPSSCPQTSILCYSLIFYNFMHPSLLLPLSTPLQTPYPSHHALCSHHSTERKCFNIFSFPLAHSKAYLLPEVHVLLFPLQRRLTLSPDRGQVSGQESPALVQFSHHV